jgi:aminoglycoside 3-N-acetyltransferase
MPLSGEDTRRALSTALPGLGVEPGRSLLFHASFRNLSHKGFLAENFLEAILAFIGDGTLALPTLSWREVSPEKPIFNEMTTRSNVGVLSEIFRARFAERRSLHPTHSVAAMGPQTDYLLKDHGSDVRPCSPSSPWGKLAGIDAQILMIDVDMDSCTLVHHLEESFDPDRYLRDEVEPYRCVGRDGANIEVRTRRHRKLNRNFWKFRELLAAKDQLRIATLAGTNIYGFSAADLVAVAIHEFERDLSASLAKAGEPSKLM